MSAVDDRIGPMNRARALTRRNRGKAVVKMPALV